MNRIEKWQEEALRQAGLDPKVCPVGGPRQTEYGLYCKRKSQRGKIEIPFLFGWKVSLLTKIAFLGLNFVKNFCNWFKSGLPYFTSIGKMSRLVF